MFEVFEPLSAKAWSDDFYESLGSKEDDYFDRKNLINITRICILNWQLNQCSKQRDFTLNID
jgi:hypothetical protein